MNPSLHYQTWGNPNHAPIVFLHGFMGRAADWADVAANLAVDFYCVGFDLPGHGASTGLPEKDYEFARAVELISHSIKQQVGRSCILAGYSMGARLALGVAAAHPGQLRALVMESGSPGLAETERKDRLQTDRTRADALATQGMPAFLEGWYDQPLFASLDQRPELRKALIEKRLQQDAGELARALTGLGAANQPDFRGALPALNRPLLVLAGALDARYVVLAREMEARHHQCRLEIIPDTGHNIHLENPRAFVQALRAFAHEMVTE